MEREKRRNGEMLFPRLPVFQFPASISLCVLSVLGASAVRGFGYSFRMSGVK
jgi:hypothetical protein